MAAGGSFGFISEYARLYGGTSATPIFAAQ
jgi:hypothetical protein